MDGGGLIEWSSLAACANSNKSTVASPPRDAHECASCKAVRPSHEPKSAPTGWVYGDAHDKVRMDRFRREGEGADYYQKALEAELAGAG